MQFSLDTKQRKRKINYSRDGVIVRKYTQSKQSLFLTSSSNNYDVSITKENKQIINKHPEIVGML